jgi:hypothetical protein
MYDLACIYLMTLSYPVICNSNRHNVALPNEATRSELLQQCTLNSLRSIYIYMAGEHLENSVCGAHLLTH